MKHKCADKGLFHLGIAMNIFINGEPQPFIAPLTLSALIDNLNLAGKHIAIELNGEIVVRTHYAHTWLNNDDRVEIITAVGGG